MLVSATSSMTRRCCKPFPCGTLLVLVMSGLLCCVHWFLFSGIAYTIIISDHFHVTTASLMYIHQAGYILLPLAGWIGESWLGRYRAIVFGLLVSAATVLIVLVGFLCLKTVLFPFPVLLVVVVVAVFIGALGFGCFYTTMLPFTLDQMIGASAEELSAAVQWYYWGYQIPLVITRVLDCVSIPDQFLSLDMLSVALLIGGSLCFSAALIMDCLCYKWLDTHDKTGNPIKLIYQVLNYARKNKCPRLRSALTYIDEEHPSRIDFGKHKFGGPFTEEEVEDVKTAFRIVPLLTVALSICLSLETKDQLSLHVITTTSDTFSCVQNMKHTGFHVAPIILVPLYRFILYPLVHKYNPSILKRIGMGLFLCFVVAVIDLNVISIGHFYSNASQCIFNDLTESGTIDIPLYWVLIIDLVNGVGVALVACSLYEFVIAQSPNRMRGIMVGILTLMLGLGVLGSDIYSQIFQQFLTASPSCVFYYYLVLSLLLLLILIVFVILAKHYKLREREKHINVQAIVEEHYERYMDQEEQYMREAYQKTA